MEIPPKERKFGYVTRPRCICLSYNIKKRKKKKKKRPEGSGRVSELVGVLSPVSH